MREPSSTPLITWSRDFPALPEHVREARHFLASILDGQPAADDAVLCLSELVTNACLHSNSRQPGGEFNVRVQACGPGLRVEVSDQGGRWTPPANDGHAPNGRGLRIVDQLACTWGRTGDASTGWTTWFEFGTPPAPPTAPGAAPEGSSQRWISVIDGHQLRRLRHQHGLSQGQLAAKAGVSESALARLERHPHITCRSRTLARLAAALGYPPTTLVASGPTPGTPSP
jgi:anti-sigma regulatory factor (Ser/Thr protein kinase)/DNA-binding XRE family transcriptional regulator